MKGIGIALIVVGALGMLLGMAMFGDIGIAAIIGSIVGILSGVGFLKVSKLLNEVNQTSSEPIPEGTD
jgi:hypothetical protein